MALSLVRHDYRFKQIVNVIQSDIIRLIGIITFMKNAIISCVAGLIIAIIYHVLVANHFYGWPLALIGLFCIVFSVGLRFLVRKKQYAWPFLFLFPAFCGIGGSILYSHIVVTIFAPFAIGISLALFVFWHAKHIPSLFAVRSLIPLEFWRDTVFPFRVLPRIVKDIYVFKRGSKILQGIVLAFPFVVLFVALFSSADPFFRHFFDESIGSFFEEGLFARFLIDVFIICYVSGSSWLLIERAKSEEIRTTHSIKCAPISQIVFVSFLSVLNILFFVFLIFQFTYFFGGEQVLRAAGISYAEYARGGFFQLLIVASIVFSISWFVYIKTTTASHTLVRIAALILIVQTSVVLLSATMRLGLYVDKYGMTVMRFWAYAGIAYVGLLLVFVSMSFLFRFSAVHATKVLFIGMLSLPSFLLLWNVEATVVRYNLKRMTVIYGPSYDMSYVMETTPAAWPTIIALLPTLPNQQQEIMRSWMEKMADKSAIPLDIRDIRLTDIFADHVLRSWRKP
ncbi:DUF4173 domain-containing protein [Candidatus Uhrbacteria bacterium]|nr:DUF4173 domain-containing protein [Candidatus Uhrbacteria bacterium]